MPISHIRFYFIVFVLTVCHYISSSVSSPTPSLSEKSSLILFYNSTTGPSWIRKDNWLIGNPCDGNRWYGIVCNTPDTHVVEIHLRDNLLNGPSSALSYLCNLTLLKTIDLGSYDPEYVAFNKFNGPSTPVKDLGKLSSLTYLDLSGYGMTGGLDSFQSLSPNLTYLSVRDQSISGPLGQLRDAPFKASITTLDLDVTHFLTGSLGDVDFDKWNNLASLFITSSNATGSLSSLKSLNNLTQLSLFATSVTGFISDLSLLTKLTYLDVSFTTVTGTLSDIKFLTNLSVLYVYDSNVDSALSHLIYFPSLTVFEFGVTSGSLLDLVPFTQIKLIGIARSPNLQGTLMDLQPLLLQNLTSIELDFCDVTGNLEYMSRWTRLTILYLSGTKVTGNLESIASLKLLTQVSLSYLKLEGNLRNLKELYPNMSVLLLAYNNLRGTLNDLSGATNLGKLSLRGNNRITGGIPADFLSHHTYLLVLDLSETSIGGTVPDAFDKTPYLLILSLHSSNFRGVIPSSLISLKNLIILTLHSNNFIGTMPVLDGVNHLRVLTIGNNLLSCQLSQVIMKSDYIQSSWEFAPSKMIKQPLITLSVVGNLISAPLPSWVSQGEQASGVLYLASSTFPEWLNLLVRVLAGVMLFLIFVVVVREGNSYRKSAASLVANKLEASHDVSAYTTSVTVVSSLFGVVFLIPIYVSGGTLYVCGDPIMKLSMTYLNETWASWVIAVMFLLYSSFVCLFCFWNVKLFHSRSDSSKITSNSGYGRVFVTVVAVMLTTSALSFPSFIYGIALSTPANNVLTSSTGVSLGWIMSGVMGPVMSLTASVLIPTLADALGNYSVGDRGTRASVGVWERHVNERVAFIMQIMLLCNLIIVPLLSGILFSNGCLGGYVFLWDSCRAEKAFTFIWEISYQEFPFLTRDSVCEFTTPRGRCARQLISIWFPVIFSQYVTSAFLGPVISLLREADMFANLRRQLANSFLSINVSDDDRRKSSRNMSVVLSTELCQVLIFGYFAPLLFVISLISFLIRGSILHVTNSKISHMAVVSRLTFSYAIFMTPILLSILVSIVYWESSWSGRELVWSTSCLTGVVTIAMIVSVVKGALTGAETLNRFGVGVKLRNKTATLGKVLTLSRRSKRVDVDNTPIEGAPGLESPSRRSIHPSRFSAYSVSIFIVICAGMDKLASLFGKTEQVNVTQMDLTDVVCRDSEGETNDLKLNPNVEEFQKDVIGDVKIGLCQDIIKSSILPTTSVIENINTSDDVSGTIDDFDGGSKSDAEDFNTVRVNLNPLGRLDEIELKTARSGSNDNDIRIIDSTALERTFSFPYGDSSYSPPSDNPLHINYSRDVPATRISKVGSYSVHSFYK